MVMSKRIHIPTLWRQQHLAYNVNSTEIEKSFQGENNDGLLRMNLRPHNVEQKILDTKRITCAMFGDRAMACF